MTVANETSLTSRRPTSVSTKAFTNQPNSEPVESIESIETFDKRREFSRVRVQKVSTAKSSNIETVESRSNVSIVSTQEQIAVETDSVENQELNYFYSKFQQFHQFQRGIVGGVSQ